MKDKFKVYIFLLLTISLNPFIGVLANDFIFDSSEITILENGNIIKANNGNAKTKKGNVEIEANNFIYIQDKQLLTALGKVFTKDLVNNITIRSENITFNKDSQILNATGDVLINDLTNNISIRSENIIINREDNTIKSNTDTIIEDNLGNLFFTKKFLFTQNDSIIKINDAKIIDIQKNKYDISKAFISLKSNKLIGKDISIDFNNIYFEKDNEPRLKGKTVSADENQTIVTKGVFTTCKKNDDCPPWQMSAGEIKHDKVKKIMYYKDAWLKIYDQPVFYFPRFFHPDFTVKRQSGFLMPSFVNSTDLGSALQTPYFHVLSDSKDFTLKPRFYSKDSFLLQSEVRSVGKQSSDIFDFSFSKDRKNGTKNHFFSKNKTMLNFNYFDEAELNYQVQHVSSDTYLKTYKLNSPIIDNENTLTSSIDLKTYNENLSFDASFIAYENLSKNPSDRYEFLYPTYLLTKEFDQDSNSNGQLIFKSSGFIKNYDTNVFEKANINDIIFNTNSKISNNGLKNNFNFLIKNVNLDSEKSKKYKNKNSHELASIMQYKVSYPLIKQLQNDTTNKVNPVMVLKYSPSNTKDISDSENRLDMQNVYSINRISQNDTVEGGASLTFGSEFVKSDSEDRNIFKTSFANVLRFEENNKLSSQSGLNGKTSDIIGNFEYSPSRNFNLNYNFSLDNNLKDHNYQEINTEFKVNNFVTSFEYVNENKTTGANSYLTNKTTYIMNNSNSFSYERRENKKTSMTEFYNLIYQYRNDCLIAGIEYNRDFYSDREMIASENIFFKLTITPFGETSSPDLLK